MPNVREALGKGGCFGREACACCLEPSVGVEGIEKCCAWVVVMAESGRG